MKKTLAALLTAALAASLLCVPALAAGSYGSYQLSTQFAQFSFDAAYTSRETLTFYEFVEGSEDSYQPVSREVDLITVKPGSAASVKSPSGDNYFATATGYQKAEGGYTVVEALAYETFTTDNTSLWFGDPSETGYTPLLEVVVGFFDDEVKTVYLRAGTEAANPEQPKADPFTDVKEGDWYYHFVNTVYEKKLFAGNPDGTFEPTADMTYGQFLAVLSQFSGDPIDTRGTPNWYDAYVSWGKDKGLVPQQLLASFDPEAPITRQDMAAIFGAFLVEYQVDYNKVTSGEAVFTDADDIADYAAGGVVKCFEAGIMGGNDDGTFNPLGTAQRCEVAVTMVQMARVMGR